MTGYPPGLERHRVSVYSPFAAVEFWAGKHSAYADRRAEARPATPSNSAVANGGGKA